MPGAFQSSNVRAMEKAGGKSQPRDAESETSGDLKLEHPEIRAVLWPMAGAANENMAKNRAKREVECSWHGR